MINILITDDSDVVAMLLQKMIESQPDMKVIGRARNGHEAVRLTHELKPDMITMDIRMPVMDGFDATRMIMSTVPTPIVVISAGIDDEELRTTFRAIDEGALAVIEKPAGIPNSPEFNRTCRNLVDTLRAMAEVKLIRRRPQKETPNPKILETKIERKIATYDVVGIVCSTGGPTVLSTILSTLPLNYPLPLLVVQHISPGFSHGLADWLRGHTLLGVELAHQGGRLSPGTVYIAPEGRHMGVERREGALFALLRDAPPIEQFRPSGTYLLNSLADCCGPSAIGAVLTGMGRDGADGLARLGERGGHIFVQDEESSTIFGMPSAAISASGTKEIIPLSKISSHLIKLARC
ncbi:MAG: chemotaxis protein CheB [Gammaproteobacteria bacterium]|nr:chemotaxis protein CheB [Gammaproteobacteria bacterium]